MAPSTPGMLLRRSACSCGPAGRFHAPLYVWIQKAGNVVGLIFLVGALARTPALTLI